ncbi:hypothetical protein [Aurantiacibacter aquimixticola]|nr:hypothetical protein [Aurantiacibacter aquimixticola]
MRCSRICGIGVEKVRLALQFERIDPNIVPVQQGDIITLAGRQVGDVVDPTGNAAGMFGLEIENDAIGIFAAMGAEPRERGSNPYLSQSLT